MKREEKTLSATEFKAKCRHLLEHLEPAGLVVTKRGQPIARVTPMASADNSHLFGNMKGKIKILGDIFSTGEKWDANS